MRLAGAARQPRQPKPLLAHQLPVDAAPPQAPHTSSSPARIANVREGSHVVVPTKSGSQAGRQGIGNKAIERWLGRPPSVMKEQRIWPLGNKRLHH